MTLRQVRHHRTPWFSSGPCSASTASNPAPFSINIGTSEQLILDANGGEDQYSTRRATLLALIAITVDGGSGTERCSPAAAPTSSRRRRNDFADGQQGIDAAPARPATTRSSWSRGGGDDVIEDQDGPRRDRVQRRRTSPRTWRSPPTAGATVHARDITNITIDLNDVERIDRREDVRRCQQPRRQQLSGGHHRRRDRPRRERRR